MHIKSVFLLTFDKLPEAHPASRRSCFAWRVRASAVDVGASVCWRPRIRSHRFRPPPCRWGSSRAAQKWRAFALFPPPYTERWVLLAKQYGLPLTSQAGGGIVLRTRYTETMLLHRGILREATVYSNVRVTLWSTRFFENDKPDKVLFVIREYVSYKTHICLTDKLCVEFRKFKGR